MSWRCFAKVSVPSPPQTWLTVHPEEQVGAARSKESVGRESVCVCVGCRVLASVVSP
jgi:hypothetical protein